MSSNTIGNYPPIVLGFQDYMNNTAGDHAGGIYRVFQFVSAFDNYEAMKPLCKITSTAADAIDGWGFFSANIELLHKRTAIEFAEPGETLAGRIHRISRNLTFACYYMVNLCALSLLLNEAKIINLAAIANTIARGCNNGIIRATPPVTALLGYVVSQERIAYLGKISQSVAPTVQDLVSNLVRPLRVFFIAAMVAEILSTLFDYSKCSGEITKWNEYMSLGNQVEEGVAAQLAEWAMVEDIESVIAAVTQQEREKGEDPLKARVTLEAAHTAFMAARKDGKTETEQMAAAKSAAKGSLVVHTDVLAKRTYTKLEAEDHINALKAKRWVLVASLVKNMVSISNQLFLLTATAFCPQLVVAVKFATPLTYMVKGILESEAMKKWIMQHYKNSGNAAQNG